MLDCTINLASMLIIHFLNLAGLLACVWSICSPVCSRLVTKIILCLFVAKEISVDYPTEAVGLLGSLLRLT